MEQKTPRLLTEAEWAGLLGPTGYQLHSPELRERGLIAPEPEPEPPVEIALKAALEGCNGFQSEYGKVAWSNGFREGFDRGKELRPTPTREMVDVAHKNAIISWEAAVPVNPDFMSFFYAALLEQMQ